MNTLYLIPVVIGAFLIYGVIGITTVPTETITDVPVEEPTIPVESMSELQKNPSSIGYHSLVKIFLNGKLWDEKENVITTAGLNLVKGYLSEGGHAAVDYLALGNSTAPAAGSTSHPGEITICGLGRSQATYYSEGDGNWTMSDTWTSSCDGISVNTTGLLNASSGGTYFAGTTFTIANLNNNDQLTVNYTVWVE